MKKLLFVLVFAFIGQQSFSQMYLVIVSSCHSQHPSACNSLSNNSNAVMTTVDPQGNVTYDCLPSPHPAFDGVQITIINQKFNSIISQGYKLIDSDGDNSLSGYMNPHSSVNGTWYFAIP